MNKQTNRLYPLASKVENLYLNSNALIIEQRYTKIVPGSFPWIVYDLHPASLTVIYEGLHKLSNV